MLRRPTLLLLAFAFILMPNALRAREAKPVILEDPETFRKDREVHDVTAVAFTVLEDTLEVAVRFRRDFGEMMFQAVDLNFDCDQSAASGMDSADLWIRASAGTRFHPNSWPPEEGARAPLTRLTTTWATVQSYSTGPSSPDGKTWTWRGSLAAPKINGNRITFLVPLAMVRNAGQRYNRKVPVRLRVEGGASEDPIPLRHLATDEGIDITINGKPDDWGGGTRALDLPSELHPDAAALDIEKVQVDHTPESLLVGVWLMAPGFGRPLAPDDDILDLDRIQVAVEPLGGEYLGFRQYTFLTGSPNRDIATYKSAAGEKFFEVEIKRPPAQNDFRVIVWSDAVRIDKVPDEGWFELDLPGGKR
jgi:hypothetical protein